MTNKAIQISLRSLKAFCPKRQRAAKITIKIAGLIPVRMGTKVGKFPQVK